MTDASQASSGSAGKQGMVAAIRNLYMGIIRSPIMAFVHDLGILGLRVPVALVFWYSGRTKVDGWNIFAVNDTQLFLFEHRFNMPFPALSATMASVMEHVLPVLLILGLFTRISAGGLLVMTMVIQLWVFPDAWWSAHMFWASILFAIIAVGPGRISVDHFLGKRYGD